MGGHSTPATSISPEEVKKLLARAEAQKFSEAPKYTQSPSSGVLHTSIAGRFDNERARLGPDFTEADRQWRIKWLKSQELHPSEPFHFPQLEQTNLNIFRRIYRYPLNFFEKFLEGFMDRPKAVVGRKMLGRSIMGYLIVLYGWYELNYNHSTWENVRGIRVHHTKEVVLPGDIRYPMPNPRTESWQHYDRGFHDRKVLLNNAK